MQPLQQAPGVVEPEWGLQQSWTGGLWGVQFCRFVDISRGGGSARQPQRTEPCQCVSDQPWACHGGLQGKMYPLECAEGVTGPALGAAAGLGKWFVGCAVLLPVFGNFQRRGQHSATTTHRALPVCEWPGLGMPWGTAKSNAASAVCSRRDGACIVGFGRGAGQVVRGGCGGFSGLWRFPEEEAVLGNHSAQSTTCV